MRIKTSKECRQITPILEMVANGNAAEKEIHTVALHIETCAACHAKYERWQQTANLVANWRTAEVPDSCRNWSDLHARLTQPQPQRLRPAFSLRVGLGGVAGAMAVGILWLALPHPPAPSPEQVRAEGKSQYQISPSAPVFVQGQEKPLFSERTMVTAPTSDEKIEKSALTFVKSEKPSLPSPRDERAKRGEGLGARGGRSLAAQTKPKPQAETSRRVILAVDGETITPDMPDMDDNRYALGAIPSGQVSGETPRYVIGSIDTSENQINLASHSSSEKTAW